MTISIPSHVSIRFNFGARHSIPLQEHRKEDEREGRKEGRPSLFDGLSREIYTQLEGRHQKGLLLQGDQRESLKHCRQIYSTTDKISYNSCDYVFEHPVQKIRPTTGRPGRRTDIFPLPYRSEKFFNFGKRGERQAKIWPPTDRRRSQTSSEY